MIARSAFLFSLLLLVGGGRMLAQPGGQMFPSFDYPYKEALKTLYQIQDLQILFEQDDTKIAVRHGQMFVVYFFEKGTLYNIVMTKNYNRARKAQEAYDGCMDYFLCTGAVPVDFCEEEDEKQVIATRNGKVYRLIMRKQDATNIDVTLSAKWVNLAPVDALEGLDFLELDDGCDEDD